MKRELTDKLNDDLGPNWVPRHKVVDDGYENFFPTNGQPWPVGESKPTTNYTLRTNVFSNTLTIDYKQPPVFVPNPNDPHGIDGYD